MATWAEQLRMIQDISDALERSNSTVTNYMDGLHEMLEYMRQSNMMEEDIDKYKSGRLKIVEMQIEAMKDGFRDGQQEVSAMEADIKEIMSRSNANE